MVQPTPEMTDPDFLKWIVTLGVGGILAAFMFVFYRKDIRQYTELWKVQSEQMMQIVKDNTASNVKLVSLIENQERNQFRKNDLLDLLEQRRTQSRSSSSTG